MKEFLRAIAQINQFPIRGSVTFEEVGQFNCRQINCTNKTVKIMCTFLKKGSNKVRVKGRIVGLTPGKHGMHIHMGKVITNCDSTGTHFNPLSTNHGGLRTVERHAGDFGNIRANDEFAQFEFDVDSISLRKGLSNSIIGRSLVIHENQDDLGLGFDEASSINGNSGPKIACAVVKLIN